MITTLPPTIEGAASPGAVRTVAAPATDPTSVAFPETRDHLWLPYVIGGLLGLLVILTLAAWAYLMLTGGDYSGVDNLSQVLQP